MINSAVGSKIVERGQGVKYICDVLHDSGLLSSWPAVGLTICSNRHYEKSVEAPIGEFIEQLY